MGRIDVLGWPLRDPRWFGTFLLIGLITLIPIVGEINTYGWMLACVDNLRMGRAELPPAGFYLSRGWRLFVVLFLYQLAAFVVFSLLFFALFFGVGVFGRSQAGGVVAGLGLVGFVILYGVFFLLALVLQGVVPHLALATDHHDVGGALNPGLVIGWIQTRTSPALIAMLLSIAAQFLSSVGVYLCFVGIFLSLPFGYAMLAGVTYNLELELGAGATSAPPAPAV